MIRRWLAQRSEKARRPETWLRAGQVAFAAGGACYLFAAAYAAIVVRDRTWAVTWMVSALIDAAIVVFFQVIIRARRKL